ncbi:lysine transporter LysE [Aliidongia dinghuensis]|uniref:Lysine transporter LysE n=1 Tax=Aliidongia dinghuensis TaxID=1867774 RepID=A0A8J2YSM5_9PROT|nr:LysE family translocator [Aliidongia dinghuensis]GGF09608.1 lysine transporter LysE [Aliidongia dinghuensis]
MNWQLVALFAVTELVLCLTPGPAVLTILSQALKHGAGRALWSIFGIIAGNTLYFVLSATSLGALLLASYELFFAIKWLGAAYLLWLGVRTFFDRTSSLAVAAAPVARGRAAGLFTHAFVVQVANPKALLFFTALLPQFVDTQRPVAVQLVVLALVSVVIEFVVQLFYACLAAQATRLALRPRFARLTNRIAGTFLIGAGVGLASLTRD